MLNWFLILIIFLFYLNTYQSQITLKIDKGAKCEPYKSLGQGYCNGLLTNPNSIYIGTGSNQTSLNTELEFYWDAIRTTGSVECKNTSSTFVTLCSFFFVECFEYPTIPATALPKRACYDNCQSALDLCAVSSDLYSCSSNNSYGALYPNGYEVFDLSSVGGPSSYNLQCFDPSDLNYKVDPSLLNCPKPLLERISNDREADTKRGYTWVTNTSTCIIDCPASIFSNSQWDTFFRLNDSLSIISTFLTLFLVVTYIILNQEKTSYDKNFSIFISGVFLMSLSGAIGSFAGRKAYCPDPGRIAVNTDATCVASGFLFQFGSVLAILWFAILAFELWWAITRIKKPLGLLKYYIPITLIITIILSCIPFRYYGYQYGIANIMCWVRGDRVQNFVFWGPLGICITIGTIFIGLVCWEIYKIVRANGRSGIIDLELKPVLMIVLIYFSFVYVFIFEFYISGKTNDYYDHIGDFFNCLITRESEDDECLFPGPSASYYGSYIYFLRIFGIYCFLIFGLSKKCLRIWQKSIFFSNKYMSTILSKFSNTTAATNSKISMKTRNTNNTSSISIGNTDILSANYYDDVGGNVDMDANYIK